MSAPPNGSFAGPPMAYTSIPGEARVPAQARGPADAHGLGDARGPEPRSVGPAEPSLSMPMVARRPWGLIAVVLLIDVALAAAGAWMLSQGISTN